MTTHPCIAVIAVISSAVLMFGNTAQAKGPTYLHVPTYGMAEKAAAADTNIDTVAQTISPTELAPSTILEPKSLVPAQKFKKLEKPKSLATQIQYSYASSSYSYSRVAVAGSSSGNTYAWGQCTWYAKSKRPDLPNGLGNGGQWVANAAALGFATGSTPRAGAIGEQPGHVVYVESVNKNGTVNISEMNYNGGVGVVHKRTVAANTFKYIY